MPYFSYSYDSVTYIKSASYDSYINPISEYDAFVYEIVERNISEILNNEQKIPAIERNNISAKETLNYEKNTLKLDRSYSEYVSIYGKLDESIFENNPNADIYVRISDGVSVNCYEAFPGSKSDGAYGYYLNLNKLQKGSTVEIIVNNCVVKKTTI